MSRSGGIGQLLKGIIMGIVLILAIIGSMSMLDKDKPSDVNNTSPTTEATDPASVTNTTPEIKAPEINIASQEATKIKPEETIKETITDSFQPVLEGEKPEDEKKTEPIKYGILKLSTINPETFENIKANYVVFDNNNTKVKESNNNTSASYRLAVGTYRVVTTLVKSTDSTARDTAPIQSTKTITITAHKLNDVVVQLEPPPTIGVLQVSAINAKNNLTLKANFIIQKENDETVASRKNVTNSLFKLKAGSYKVTVKSGNNSDFRTIVVEPGESITEVFKLQEAFTQGKLFVRIIGIQSNTPVRGDIEISTPDERIVQALKAVSQTEIALTTGNYKIKVSGSKGVSSKNITIVAGQSSNQTFRIDEPLATAIEPVKINENVKITGVGETKPAEEVVESTNTNANQNTAQQDKPVKSILKLFARNAVDQKPLKSNFYVQTPNGKNVDKKIYADSAQFNLPPGKYKITIRSKNRKNIVRNIQVSANQAITEVFSLQSNIPQTKPATTAAPNRELAPPKPAKSPSAIPNGFLNVAMQPARNTHFIIANRKGKKVVELTSVPSGNFKLDTGIYVVTAILNGQRRKQTIQVHQGKTARLNFNASDFQKKAATNNSAAVKNGKLRSRIVDNTGRPLKGNITVANARGQVVARANNVTFGVFDLPATPHTVSINYQGLSGSERVNINVGKTTVQTFTISPNNTRPALQKPAPVQQPRDANDILRDKLKEELRRIF
jgi:hypothetical protein